jgi:hypothetical protein
MVSYNPQRCMRQTSNSLPGGAPAEPNAELIRQTGWAVKSIHGDYCVAWRGADEIVLRWQAGGWVRVAGRGEFKVAGEFQDRVG